MEVLTSCFTDFLGSGNVQYLELAIMMAVQGVELLKKVPSERLNQLENALLMVDPGLTALPTSLPDLAVFLNNLGVFLAARSSVTGEQGDLVVAIRYCVEASTSIAIDHPANPDLYFNTMMLYRQLYQKCKNLEHIEVAVVLGRTALSTAPAGHPNRPYFIMTLASSLESLYNRTDSVKDLKDAVHFDREVLNSHDGMQLLENLQETWKGFRAIVPPPSATSSFKVHCARRLHKLYGRLKDLEDLEQAIDLSEEVLATLRCDKGVWKRCITQLDDCLKDKYHAAYTEEDLLRYIQNGETILGMLPLDDPQYNPIRLSMISRLRQVRDSMGNPLKVARDKFLASSLAGHDGSYILNGLSEQLSRLPIQDDGAAGSESKTMARNTPDDGKPNLIHVSVTSFEQIRSNPVPEPGQSLESSYKHSADTLAELTEQFQIQSHLCDLCKAINFAQIFVQDIRETASDIVPPPRTLLHIKNSVSCPLCILTLKALTRSQILECEVDSSTVVVGVVIAIGLAENPDTNRERIPGRRNERAKTRFDIHLSRRGPMGVNWIVQDPYPIHRPIVKLRFVINVREPSFESLGPGRPQNDKSRTIQLLADPGVTEESPPEVRDKNLFCGRLVGNQIDFTLIEKWLSSCERDHAYKQCGRFDRTGKRRGVAINLIEVRAKQLVRADASYRYLTLSYVWGGQQNVCLSAKTEKLFFSPGGLSDGEIHLPNTIKDAMTLCESIGERYLWIDSFCIMQDNPAEKATQIENMGMIYKSAIMTIVQASGVPKVSVATPLPGVREHSRETFQQIQSVGPCSFLISGRRPFRELVETCEWRTRGWTFQEEHLSRRLLYLTDGGAFFRCRKNFYSEDIVYEPPDSETTVKLPNNSWDAPREQKWRSQLETFLGRVSAYTERQLTYDSDILDAITAVLGEFDGEMPDIQNAHITNSDYYGLPSAAFDFAVCWLETKHDPLSRRYGYPSWSWLGWKCQVSFDIGDRCRDGSFDSSERVLTNSLYTSTLMTPGEDIYSPLRSFYNIQVAPRAAVYEEMAQWHSRNMYPITTPIGSYPVYNSKLLYFTTTHARLRIGDAPVAATAQLRERENQLEPQQKFKDRTSSSGTRAGNPDFANRPLYQLSSTRQPSIPLLDCLISLDPAWRASQPALFELDFIVIRASDRKIEPYVPQQGSSNDPYTNIIQSPSEWLLNLMCVVPTEARAATAVKHFQQPQWAEQGVLWERFAMAEGRVTAQDWMTLDPKPKESLIVLG